MANFLQSRFKVPYMQKKVNDGSNNDSLSIATRHVIRTELPLT